MRGDVGGPGDAPAEADLHGGEQRVTLDGRQQIRLRLDRNPVVAQQVRPFTGEVPGDRMSVGQLRDGALRHLHPVVPGVDGHRQYPLDSRAAVGGLRLDALETQVAAGHHQTAAVQGHPVGQFGQPIRGPLAADPGVGVQQNAVGPDIGQHHHVVFLQFLPAGEVLRDLVRRQVGHLEVTVLQSVPEKSDATFEGHRGECVKALEVGRLADPGFPCNQCPDHVVVLPSLSACGDDRHARIIGRP